MTIDDLPVVDAGSASAARSLGPIVVPLLKGVVYREADQTRWLALLHEQAAIRDHLRVLALELVIDDAEGYAFVRSPAGVDHGDDPDDPPPRLVARRPLTFSVSLLLALLRRRLAEADASGGDTRLVLARSEIADLVSVFLPTSANQAKLIDKVEADITKVVELGFLRRLGTTNRRTDEPRYEVRRVLKAFVDAQWLHEFDTRLSEYRQMLEAGGGHTASDALSAAPEESVELDDDAFGADSGELP